MIRVLSGEPDQINYIEYCCKMNLEKVNEIGSSKQFTITSPYLDIVEAIGEPHLEDDPDKVDVSWHVRDVDTDRHLAVWNYKNGPAYLGESVVTIEDIEYFSACGDKSLAEDLGLNVSY